MDAPLPVIDDAAQPCLLRVAQQVLDRGAHVQGAVRLADLLDVGHGGYPFDEDVVPLFGLGEALLGLLALG